MIDVPQTDLVLCSGEVPYIYMVVLFLTKDKLLLLLLGQYNEQSLIYLGHIAEIFFYPQPEHLTRVSWKFIVPIQQAVDSEQ